MIMKVGVLIPTFNREYFLAQALGSILEQTFCDLEILVIDNASSDGTSKFMTGISDPKVRYIVNENNLGMIGSINKGIRLFTDDVTWCTILGDDDLLDIGYIASMLDFVGAYAVKAIAHGHRKFIDSVGHRLRDAVQAPLVESSLEYISDRSAFKRETFLTGVFFSRKAFEKIGGYPKFTTGMATDDAFIFALSLQDNLYFNRQAVAFVRFHSEAESHRTVDAIKHLQALKEFKDYVELAARNANKYSPGELERLDRTLHKYIRHHNGALLLRSINALLDNDDKMSFVQLTELYKIAENKDYAFLTCVKVYVVLLKIFDIFPGCNRMFRFIWQTLAKIKHVFAIHRS